MIGYICWVAVACLLFIVQAVVIEIDSYAAAQGWPTLYGHMLHTLTVLGYSYSEAATTATVVWCMPLLLGVFCARESQLKNWPERRNHSSRRH